MPVLELRGVVKDYRGLRPLRLQHLVVDHGERVALAGLDAAAAEILSNLITGSHLPDAGEVLVSGRSTASIQTSDDWMAFVDRIGIVSPRAVLLEPMTAAQNLAVPFTLELEPVPAEALARVRALANDIGLREELLDVAVAALDAHDQTLVRLGRAIALGPMLLLLEHPSATLSDDAAFRLGRTVGAVATTRRLSVLAITAHRRFADALGARVLTLQAATGAVTPAAGWRRWFS